MLADIRYTLRSLLRSPVFTLVSVASLGLGIGANTAIFGLVNAVILRSLPVPDPDRLVLFTVDTPDRYAGDRMPRDMDRQIREKTDFFDGFAAFATPQMSLSGSEGPEPVIGELVSDNFFQTLGVNAIRGRVLGSEDERSAVCVISYNFWKRRFGSDPGIIGRKIQINDQPLTIVGVTPRGFTGLEQVMEPDVSVPLLAPGMSSSVDQRGFGRLKPGVAAAQAQPAIDALYQHFRIAAAALQSCASTGTSGL